MVPPDLLACFDRVLDTRVLRARLVRRMKSLTIGAVALTVLVIADLRLTAGLFAQLSSPTSVGVDLVRWGSFILSLVVALVGLVSSFVMVRSTFLAHKAYTEAALQERVHIATFHALKEQVSTQHKEIREDIAELRGLVITAITKSA